MECRHVQHLLHETLERMLDTNEQERLDTHLAQCASCRMDARLLYAVIQAVEEAPILQPSEDFTLKVMDRLPTPIGVFGRIPVAAFRALVVLLGVAAVTLGWVYQTTLLQIARGWSTAAASPNPISSAFQQAAVSIHSAWGIILGYMPHIDTQRMTPVVSVLIAIGVAHVILKMVDGFEPAEFDSAVDQTF